MTTKKEVLQYLMNALEPMIPVVILKKHKSAGAVIFDSVNGNKIDFTFITVVGGRNGKGSFVMTFNMALYNPVLSDLLKKPFNVAEGSPTGLVSVLTSDNDLPKDLEPDRRYSFCVEGDNKETADHLLDDIRQYFIPYLAPFLGDYDRLLDFFKDPLFVRSTRSGRQFRIGVCAALLTNREDAIKEFLVPLAESNNNKNEILDFKKASDYQTELVDPIKNYAVENNLIEN